MLQLHLSDQQFNCLQRCLSYYRFYSICYNETQLSSTTKNTLQRYQTQYILKRLHNLNQCDRSSSDKPSETKNHDANVESQFPPMSAQLVRPKYEAVKDGREDERDGATGQRTDERDHQIQVRHHSRNSNWKTIILFNKLAWMRWKFIVLAYTVKQPITKFIKM